MKLLGFSALLRYWSFGAVWQIGVVEKLRDHSNVGALIIGLQCPL